MTAPLVQLPRYGEGTIGDVLPAVLAAIGVDGETDILGLPQAHGYCVLLIDGLGWNLLRRHVADAPFLGSLLPDARALSVGVPSTTATSLTSLGTGLPPGRHGIVGYTSRRPGTTDVLLNALTWDPQVDPIAYQPHPTVFERAVAADVSVTVVSKRQFRDSGLTLAGLRGPLYRGADALGERVAAVAEELARRGRSLTYVYDGDLDYTGHRHGCVSAAWRHQLVQLDRFAEQIYDELSPGTGLLVTADHGMIDVPLECRIDIDDKPELREGVELIGGEARFRHVYVKPGSLPDVRALWEDVVGEHAIIATRDEAVAAGWFGAVEKRVLDRIGDLLVVSQEAFAVELRSVFPFESKLVGLHGGFSDDELLVPLLAAVA